MEYVVNSKKKQVKDGIAISSLVYRTQKREGT